MAWVFPLAISLTSLFSPPAAPPAPPPIQIEIRPEVYDAYTFSAGQPPPHPVEFPALELGWCATQLHPQAAVKLEWNRLGLRSVTAKVTIVQLVVSMRIVVWTQEGTGPRVTAHEATHRAISEYYYAMAKPVAEALCKDLLGRKVKLSVRHQSADAAEETETLSDELTSAFNWRVWSRCRYAQRRFDEVTDHGRNPITNEAAKAQALAEEAAHWETVKNLPPQPDDSDNDE